jgi:hypothetical protein
MAAPGEKPYRVYRGGRQKGKVPLPHREAQRRRIQEPQPQRRDVRRRPQRVFSRGRAVLWSLVAVVVVLIVWALAGYLSVRSGVSDANKRIETAAPGIGGVLAPTGGLLLSNPANILLIGTDHSENGQAGRSTDQHSDSLMLLHTDP